MSASLSSPSRPRRKRTQQHPHIEPTPAQPQAEAPHVHVIQPNAIYFAKDFQRVFRLRDSTIRREIRKGRLRVSRRGGHYMFLGQWLLEWLASGERAQPVQPAPQSTSA